MSGDIAMSRTREYRTRERDLGGALERQRGLQRTVGELDRTRARAALDLEPSGPARQIGQSMLRIDSDERVEGLVECHGSVLPLRALHQRDEAARERRFAAIGEARTQLQQLPCAAPRID